MVVTDIRSYLWWSKTRHKKTGDKIHNNQRVYWKSQFDPYRHKVLSYVISPRTFHIYQRYDLWSGFEVSPKYSKQKKTDHICIQTNRFTLYQCTKINRFLCKIFTFRTKNDRSFSVSSTSGWLRSHFKGRVFGKYGKSWGIWRVTKLYAYKGRIALFDFQ